MLLWAHLSHSSAFFLSFKEPKCQTDDWFFKHSLVKICIHGNTTVRTANIRDTLFLNCSILPKSKQLLVRGKFHINIVLQLTITLELIYQTLHFKLLGRLSQRNIFKFRHWMEVKYKIHNIFSHASTDIHTYKTYVH